MKRVIQLLCLATPLMGFALDNTELANQYFSETKTELSNQEKQALKIAERTQTGEQTSKPFASADGSISFVFGSGQIRIVCAPLQVCDIALQQGEEFNDMNVGDPRFVVEPSITGSGASQQIHMLIKPKDVGLDSSLVVTTDKRTYHFRLKSDRTEYMPYISFIYPDEMKAKWQQLQRIQEDQRKRDTLPETQEYLGNLDFNYQIKGNASFKPIRVYNNGVKTIIEMPKAMNQSEAPALLVLKGRGFFRKSETAMVNYRLQGSRYIVDDVFDKAILVIGNGSSQEKITIIRCAK